MITPYEFHDKKLGVKTKFLINDRDKHPDSLCLISYNAINKRVKSDTCTEKELRKGSYGGEALILFSSLPQEWRDRLTTRYGNPKEEVKKSWFAQNYISDRDAFDFYMAFKFENGEKLELPHVEQYTYNASMLNTVLQMKTDRKAYLKALGCNTVDIWDSLSRDVNAFRDVAHTLPSTRNSLQRKATEYAKFGYAALVSGKHTTKNAAKVKEKEQTALISELVAKHTNLDNELIASLYNMVAERLQWKKITAQTVGNHKTESNLVTYAGRNGVSALSNKVLMQNKRSKPSSPMLYWTLDGWDAELLFQKSTTDKKGNSVTTYHNRLTMVVVLDPFNKYPVGYAIGSHETPELIKQALRNAVNHTAELFGARFKPYQLQSDNYQSKALTPFYEACTKHYTPAKVKNAKSKVIEPYFSYINKTYCRLMDNWSGFNVNSGSKNQPNDEMLNKIRHTFPDENGCRQQLESIIIAERSKKGQAYIENWANTSDEHRLPMLPENYLMTMGATTGETNKLAGTGLNVTLLGQKLTFDSFDLNFRKQSHQDWTIMYDENDLSQVLAVSQDTQHRFVLERKHIQSMALADQKENDPFQLSRVRDFNKNAMDFITSERQQNAELMETLFQNPLLNDTLAKHVLVDSRGQHKDQRNKQRLEHQGKRMIEVAEIKAEKAQVASFQDQQLEYHNQKIDITQYLQ